MKIRGGKGLKSIFIISAISRYCTQSSLWINQKEEQKFAFYRFNILSQSRWHSLLEHVKSVHNYAYDFDGFTVFVSLGGWDFLFSEQHEKLVDWIYGKWREKNNLVEEICRLKEKKIKEQNIRYLNCKFSSKTCVLIAVTYDRQSLSSLAHNYYNLSNINNIGYVLNFRDF